MTLGGLSFDRLLRSSLSSASVSGASGFRRSIASQSSIFAFCSPLVGSVAVSCFLDASTPMASPVDPSSRRQTANDFLKCSLSEHPVNVGRLLLVVLRNLVMD